MATVSASKLTRSTGIQVRKTEQLEAALEDEGKELSHLRVRLDAKGMPLRACDSIENTLCRQHL